MVAQGWVVVSIDYRVGRRATWPDHIVDVNTALAWVQEHIAEYGGDPGFVAITGGSAGGHLASLAALSQHDPEYMPASGSPAVIRACVPFYGVHDFENGLGLRAPGEQRLIERSVVKASQTDVPDVFTRATPLARVHDGAPPFLVVQGSSDNLVTTAESRAFVDRLRTAGAGTVAYAEVPRGLHEFDALPTIRTAHVVAGVERFLDRVCEDHRRAALTSTADGNT
jgi:acetyl esterase/lipase